MLDEILNLRSEDLEKFVTGITLIEALKRRITLRHDYREAHGHDGPGTGSEQGGMYSEAREQKDIDEFKKVKAELELIIKNNK